MVLRKDLPRQELPDARLRTDGRPMGSKCTDSCKRPTQSQAHCSVCHSSMRSVSFFDQHRMDGWCLDLPALGLIEVGGLWATPEGHAQRDASRAMLASRRFQPSGAGVEATAGPSRGVGSERA